MEFIVAFLFLALLCAFVFAIFYTIYHFFRLEFFEPIADHLAMQKGISATQRLILENNVSYYNNLKPSKKVEFERRLKYFLLRKEFIGKDLPAVTEEMKVTVGAAAVQLTFGYAPLRFPFFSKIILFPGRFYSKSSRQLKKGEVNSVGLIILSWKDFIKDYKITNDGRNVGLHEMAHALKIEDATQDEEYAFLSDDDVQNFFDVSLEEFEKIRRGEKSFIRSYGGTNMEEFFAVSVEQFFEQPEQFREQLPEIYQSLSRLLRQDPLLK